MTGEGLSAETQRWDLDTSGTCCSSVFQSESFCLIRPADGFPLLLLTPTEKATPVVDPYPQGSFWLARLGSGGHPLMQAAAQSGAGHVTEPLASGSCTDWMGFFQNKKQRRNLRARSRARRGIRSPQEPGFQRAQWLSWGDGSKAGLPQNREEEEKEGDLEKPERLGRAPGPH